MIDSQQVLLLCMAIAMFISWIMALKIQLIHYLDEASRLRQAITPRDGALNGRAKSHARLTHWVQKSDDVWQCDTK